MFLLWPVLLAMVMVHDYWPNLTTVISWVLIVLTTCATTAIVALFCSVVFHRTAMSLITTYLVIITLFCLPLACLFFAETFFPESPSTEIIRQTGVTSPFAAVFSAPFKVEMVGQEPVERVQQTWNLVIGYFAFTACMFAALTGCMLWLFHRRWRVAS